MKELSDDLLHTCRARKPYMRLERPLSGPKVKEKWYESFTKTVAAPSPQGLLPLVADLLGLSQTAMVQRMEPPLCSAIGSCC